MNRTTLLCVSVLLAASAQGQTTTKSTKPYHRFESSQEDGRAVLRFYDADNAVIASVFRDGERLMIRDKEGIEAWIQTKEEKENGATIRTITSSTGKSLKLMFTQMTTQPTDGPKPLRSVKIWRSNGWIELNPTQARLVAVEEKALFDSPQLQKLYSLMTSAATQRGEPGTVQIVPQAAPLQRDMPRLQLTQSQCRATCVRITFGPIYLCVDNALPDVCPCPAATWALWDLSCCCSFLDFTCLVECSRFPAPPIARLEDDRNGIRSDILSARHFTACAVRDPALSPAR